MYFLIDGLYYRGSDFYITDKKNNVFDRIYRIKAYAIA